MRVGGREGVSDCFGSFRMGVGSTLVSSGFFFFFQQKTAYEG